jgi:hypothetical protein
MKINKPIKISILLFFLMLFTNCETITDCISRIKPDLMSKELSVGAVYQNYNDSVTFQMIRGNTDDYLIYEVSVEGNLPPNIKYYWNNDTINFNGIPNTAGVYEFTVTIFVKPYEYNSDGTDDLCGNGASKKYKIIIN